MAFTAKATCQDGAGGVGRKMIADSALTEGIVVPEASGVTTGRVSAPVTALFASFPRPPTHPPTEEQPAASFQASPPPQRSYHKKHPRMTAPPHLIKPWRSSALLFLFTAISSDPRHSPSALAYPAAVLSGKRSRRRSPRQKLHDHVRSHPMRKNRGYRRSVWLGGNQSQPLFPDQHPNRQRSHHTPD